MERNSTRTTYCLKTATPAVTKKSRLRIGKAEGSDETHEVPLQEKRYSVFEDEMVGMLLVHAQDAVDPRIWILHAEERRGLAVKFGQFRLRKQVPNFGSSS